MHTYEKLQHAYNNGFILLIPTNGIYFQNFTGFKVQEQTISKNPKYFYLSGIHVATVHWRKGLVINPRHKPLIVFPKYSLVQFITCFVCLGREGDPTGLRPSWSQQHLSPCKISWPSEVQNLSSTPIVPSTHH